MADPSSIGEIAKAIVDFIAGFVPEGPLRTLVLVVYGLWAAIAPFIFKYYLGILGQGTKPEGSLEREDYDGLRKSLKEGNLAARLYAKWLAKFLDWIERFFGDAGMADRTLFPHAFGLKTPAPLWTPPALDRCLLLALIYPLAAVYLIWAISGHTGPAEKALLLRDDFAGWQRALSTGSLGFVAFVAWRSALADGWRKLIWLLSAAAASMAAVVGPAAVAGPVAFASAAAVGMAAAVAGTFPIAGAGAGAAAVAVVFAFAINIAIAFAGAGAGAMAGAGAISVAIAFAVPVMSALAADHGWHGRFLAVFIAAMIAACFVGAQFVAPMVVWPSAGPLLLFLGLLTPLNAPFDWASLGLTRALLRRGLELGGWWPYLLALADACLAGVIIGLLALTMVLGVQAFDELAVHGGGAKAAVLPLDQLFDGIAKNPGAPEYWWAYALLLSTMIPSLINLAIGGMALTRGLPGLDRVLLLWTPEGRDVPEYKRPFVAAGLTLQMFMGALLGIAAQAFLAWVLLYHLMPAVGLDLLWLCQQLADLDLPGKFFRLTGIIP